MSFSRGGKDTGPGPVSFRGGKGHRTWSGVPVLGFSQESGSRPSESLVVVGFGGWRKRLVECWRAERCGSSPKPAGGSTNAVSRAMAVAGYAAGARPRGNGTRGWSAERAAQLRLPGRPRPVVARRQARARAGRSCRQGPRSRRLRARCMPRAIGKRRKEADWTGRRGSQLGRKAAGPAQADGGGPRRL